MADNQPIGGLTDQQLEFAGWYVNNKDRIVVAAKGVLFFGTAAIWLYVLVMFALLVLDTQNFNRQVASLTVPLVDHAYWRAQHRPQQLQFGSVSTRSIGNNRYDFFVLVDNPNDDWAVSQIAYQFVAGDGVIEDTASTWVLPGQQKYLVKLGVELPAPPRAVQLEITELHWRKASDYAERAAEVDRFEISSVDFAASERQSGRVPISTSSFTITNNSAYSYWDMGLYVILMQGGTPAAITYVVQEGLDALETRSFEVNWYQPLSRPSSTTIIPDINFLDPSVYRPVTGQGSNPR